MVNFFRDPASATRRLVKHQHQQQQIGIFLIFLFSFNFQLKFSFISFCGSLSHLRLPKYFFPFKIFFLFSCISLLLASIRSYVLQFEQHYFLWLTKGTVFVFFCNHSTLLNVSYIYTYTFTCMCCPYFPNWLHEKHFNSSAACQLSLVLFQIGARMGLLMHMASKVWLVWHTNIWVFFQIFEFELFLLFDFLFWYFLCFQFIYSKCWSNLNLNEMRNW